MLLSPQSRREEPELAVLYSQHGGGSHATPVYIASSTILQQMRRQDSSSAVITWEPSLIPAIDGKEQGDGHLLIAHVTAWQKRLRASSSALMTVEHVAYML